MDVFHQVHQADVGPAQALVHHLLRDAAGVLPSEGVDVYRVLVVVYREIVVFSLTNFVHSLLQLLDLLLQLGILDIVTWYHFFRSWSYSRCRNYSWAILSVPVKSRTKVVAIVASVARKCGPIRTSPFIRGILRRTNYIIRRRICTKFARNFTLHVRIEAVTMVSGVSASRTLVRFGDAHRDCLLNQVCSFRTFGEAVFITYILGLYIRFETLYHC